MNLRTICPVVKKNPEGFLVYAGNDLWTEKCVSRGEASRIFEILTALNPSVRIQILGVHAMDRNPKRETSR